MAALPTPALPAALPLHGDLTVQVAAERRSELLGLLAQCGPGAPCHLDLSDLVDVDSAGVQLLLALRRSLSEQGSSLHLAGVRGSLAQALASYHLDADLRALDLLGLDPQPADAARPLGHAQTVAGATA
jgi:ABC-type transporter Mla MlaB component